MNRLYNTVVPSRDAIYNPQGCSELIHFLNISLKIHFQTVIKTLKQIATGSPLDAANYNPLL